MATWRTIPGAETLPRTQASVVTIGMFDGVHRGHQALLGRARDVAPDLPLVAVTFEPHPVAVFAPDRVPAALTTPARRVQLLHRPGDAPGADEVRVLAFDRAMAAWTPREFVERVVARELRAAHVVVGENFTFGARAAGTTETLRELGAELGYATEVVTLTGDAEAWSSTRVRRLVADGAMREAAAVLGRPHEVAGTVVRGEQRGRELGYPTANVPVDDAYAVPPDGVYAGRLVRASGEALTAAVSIGTNPTFGQHTRRVESYVLDRTDLDLYGEDVRVELVERLRGMEAFDGVEALLDQMRLDVEQTRSIID